ncbi:MAG: arsenate reductase ArsC [Prosthecochloris sp.]|nr:arsenate reductase ArsC [Prosthecochloris sp.]
MSSPSILILCTGNSCRSQMAAGFLRSFDPGLQVRSAGTRPAERVHPLAVDVMQEKGIDIGTARPESVDRHLETAFDYVITVCDGAQESCPMFTGNVGNRMHIGFEDPALAEGNREEQLAVFRRIRDEIEQKFREFYDAISDREDTP